jgi:phosphonatase-like hydrolase
MKALAAAAAVPVFGAARGPLPAIRLVVLDVGGTIIEDRGDLPEALRGAMAHHGVTVSLAEINQWRGASKREIVRHFVKEEKLADEIYREFTANLIAIYRGVPPIAGVEEAFRALRDGGLLLAANTGFDRPITNSIFQRLGWEKYFACTICSDDVTQGRPSPFMIFHAMEAARVNNVAEVAAVGDTPLDLQAGTNAGARAVIGVLSGIGTRERLRSEPHTQILGSVADLPNYLLKNGRRPTATPANPAPPA